MGIFYKPRNGTVGDVIPYYENGVFKPFYLRGAPGYFGSDKSTGWTMLETTDHLHFTERPTGIHGGTGSVLLVDGIHHLFYCTFKQNPKRETVCHAVSHDGMKTWHPLPEDSFTADGDIYELTDWRDPFVFRNEETQEWWMLLAAKAKGKTARRGCVALCVSDNLKNWKIREPLYAPHMHTSAHECPDLFRWGDWYYLIYSQYTDRFQTYYRMSKSPGGPWISPAVDSFDTRCFYAAKTGFDGKNRYLYGWNPTRYYDTWGWNPEIYPGHDYNSFDWGGTMVVHELVQNDDGTLGVKAPEPVNASLTTQNELPVKKATGNWNIAQDSAGVDTSHGYAALTYQNLVPNLCKLEMDLQFSETVKEMGVALQVDKDFDTGYYISIQPARRRIEFKTGLRMYDEGGWTFPYDVEFERPIDLKPGTVYNLKLFIQDSILEIYLGGQVALSTRMFDYTHRHIALFASHGQASFTHIKLLT